MNLIATFHRFFGTETWRKEQSLFLAGQRFPAYDQIVAATVLRCLVEELDINFEQLHPHTNLIRDLAADDWEPVSISLWLNSALILSISPQQVANSRTVGGLMESVFQAINE